MQNEREKDLIIEARFHRQLIGPKGENIQKIRDDFAAVQISFPDLGSKSDIVKLRGPKDDVEKCSRTLNKMYKDLLGMFLHRMSIILIFGHKHFKQKFTIKLDIFQEKISMTFDIGSYFGSHIN